MCTDAGGCGGVVGVDADGVGGAVGVFVRVDHLGQLELRGERGGERGADDARGVAHHEGHLFGRHVAGGDDEVAFVFAGGRVEDDDEFAVFWEGPS